MGVDRDAPGQFGALAFHYRGQVTGGQAHLGEQLLIEEGLGRAARPIFCDRAEAELGCLRVAELAHHEHVERGAQRTGHFGGDRDTAARDGEDDRGARQAIGGHAGGKGEGTDPFGIIGSEFTEDFPQPRAKQHPRLGAIPEGGRTGRHRVAVRVGTDHLTGAYTRRAAE